MMKNKKRKNSLLNSTKEAFFFACAMLAALIPAIALFLNADKLGIWWIILFFIYNLILIVFIYAIYRYREIVEIRGYFTQEEFQEKFQKEALLIKIMDKVSKIFFN